MLGEYVREHLQIDRVISSDLKRCTQTADALGIPYERDRRLREFDFGDLTGKKWEDIMTEHTEVAQDILSSRTWARRPNGESSFDVAARAAGFIHESGILKQDSNCALISHGGFIKRLICVLLDLPLRYHTKFDINNTSITVLARDTTDPQRRHGIGEAQLHRAPRALTRLPAQIPTINLSNPTPMHP